MPLPNMIFDVNFKDDVLGAIASKMGYQFDVNFLQDQSDSYVRFINIWVRRLWDSYDWPFLTLVEQRTPVNNIISFQQAGKLPIQRVLRVYLIDPFLFAAFDTPFQQYNNGIVLGAEIGPTVFVKYIPTAFQYTATPWSATTTYALNDEAFDTVSGNVFVSLQANNINNPFSDPNWWLKVPFPYDLVDAVVRGAYSDALREEGQTEKANVEEQAAIAMNASRASVLLNQPSDILTAQQRVTPRYKVEVPLPITGT